MTQLNTLLALALLSLLVCCHPDSSDVDRPYLKKQWQYAPDGPSSPVYFRDPITTGNVATFRNDSVLLQNRFTGWKYVLPLASSPENRDTMPYSVTVTEVDNQLQLKFFLRDSLIKSGLFEEFITANEVVDPIDLAGQTFLFNNGSGDSCRIYIGYDPNLSFSRGSKSYFVMGDKSMNQPASKILDGNYTGIRGIWDAFSPRPIDQVMFYRFSGAEEPGLGSSPFELRRNAEGQISAHYVVNQKGTTSERSVDLNPLASAIPADVSLAEISGRLINGRLEVDLSYPPADSADVEYAYEDRFLRWGVYPEDINTLEINFNPDGEYFLFAGDRLLAQRKWELSPDRNFIVLVKEDGAYGKHFPIINYTDESIDLRIPLNIRTREPRGVELTSYVEVDAYLSIK